MTISELSSEWLKVRQTQVRQKTYDSNELAVRFHISKKLGKIKWAELTEENCLEFLQGLYDRDLSESSVKLYYLPLRQMLKWALKDKKAFTIADQAWRKHDHPNIPPKNVRPLFPDERAPFLAECSKHSHGEILRFIMATGLRCCEARNLRYSDVNLGGRAIYVRDSKTKSGIRTVPLSAGVIELIKDRMRLAKLEKLQGKSDPHVFVVPDGKTGVVGPYTHAKVYGSFVEAMDAAGLDRLDRGVHALRHTFAVSFLDAGGQLEELMKLLGHSNLNVTMQYLKWRQPKCHDVVDRMFAPDAGMRAI